MSVKRHYFFSQSLSDAATIKSDRTIIIKSLGIHYIQPFRVANCIIKTWKKSNKVIIYDPSTCSSYFVGIIFSGNELNSKGAVSFI